MLKLTQKNDKEKIIDFCSNSLLGAYIICRLETYGFDYDFARYWINEDENGINALVSAFDHTATVYATDCVDIDELKEFIYILGFKEVITDEKTAEKCSFDNLIYKQSFVYKSSDSVFSAEDDIDMKQAYKLISKAIPNSFEDSERAYLSFLSDFTFRRNRSHARIKGFTDTGTVVSCALTSAETSASAVISGVACDEKKRGCGLGKRTVLSLANELSNEKKEVYVIALNENAEKFYEKIGFEKYKKIAYINIER